MSNRFDIYSSKVKRVNIPIPEFKFFHKASSEEEVDPKFIGREHISDKLYSWLKDDPIGGSYLVTGFRGMGKSSFVGRLLNKLVRRTTMKEYITGVVFFLSIISAILFVFYLSVHYYCFSISGSYKWVIVEGILFTLATLSLYQICNFLNYDKKAYNKWKKYLVKLMRQEVSDNDVNDLKRKEEKIVWKHVCQTLHYDDGRERSYKRICVSVNLGQEILNEREVLSLISHQLYTKYREYVLSPIANFGNWLLCTGVILSISFILVFQKKVTISPLSELSSFVILLISSLLIMYLISRSFSSSQISILSRLRLLNQRLDAQVSFDESFGSQAKILFTTWGAGFWKKRVYGLAKIREIEQELIDLMDNISRGISFNYSLLKHPSIIVVFDELDKVDSSSISNSIGDTQAEFSNEKNFPGGGTTRRRKQNVLHLLANMKLFVSTAKAKFIFISGRELYDAYLADLSDREFAVSSIFSGVIYVDSFCVNEHKGKDVMSNVENYICNQLIPRKYIEKQFARYYAMELVNGTAFERFDINLKLYYQYLVDVYRDYLSESFLEPFCEEDAYTEKDIMNYMYRSYIDKAINLLYHFSVYLYHISNGSPKKMMLYFEKYVRTCYDKGQMFNNVQQDEITAPNPDININILAKEAPKYYLSFGYVDQRKIGFIHYLSYPVNQILVNANQYSDKLLVSVSFLVDHIYKFHNGGFSWRNLEYTPELLEVYKIPGFRNFINSIISYLQQTHLIAITCGLFQFKFRKQIAEEISLASKYSEEIAALFNFTLDESLNVKQHYSEIRNAYLELEGRGDEQTPKHTPRLSIGFHNILGDLYMFDEEYNNAIFEYHVAVKELEKEMEKKKEDYPDLRNTLYFIQLLLKLGLVNEKRNTNESALTVYSELVARLIDFRHFDEKELELTYRLRKHFDWPTYEGVLVPKKYDYSWNLDFNKVHPRIVNESDNLLHHTSTPFMASGQHLSTAFAHLLTPEKYSVMQRLSLFQDSRLIYQALLAKLFVKEKIGMGGITTTDIETIESEYNYLNLATNTSEKFLSSSDFFRRLGDIMFYKNGLTVTTPNDGNNGYISFMDGLYYWGYDIKRELLDFCNVNNCYEHYEMLLKVFKEIYNHQIEITYLGEKLDKILYVLIRYINLQKMISNPDNKITIKDNREKLLSLFFKDDSPHIKMLKLIPTKEVIACNKHRQEMFKSNKSVPCFACNYYSRSMRILMRGMFNCEILEERIGKSCSVFIIMEKLLVKGASRSLRQDYVIQLAEILDCRANVLLSCVAKDDNLISSAFLQDFITFIESIDNINPDDSYNTFIKEKIDNLDNKYSKQLRKLEECIIYYWEASRCFSIANDLMKASASLKKILRIFQNYLKTLSNTDIVKRTERINLVFKNIENIKKAFVKPCLIYLFSHYNNINFAEIQKLKWVFSVQTYEDIPFNRLSLFPDVEQILLLYYDLLRRCEVGRYTQNNDKDTKELNLLSKIYHNTTLGSLRQDSTIYERVMALRFKTLMNNDFLYNLGLSKDLYYQKEHEKGFANFFLNYVCSEKTVSEQLGELKHSFRFAIMKKSNSATVDGKNDGIKAKLDLLEFLIKDSLFCLTRILEIITPHTSSTLFSNSFYGEIYQLVYEWYMLFEETFLAYKYFEDHPQPNTIGRSTYKYLIEVFNSIYKKEENVEYHKIEEFFKNKYKKQKDPLDSERFFNETAHELSKAQANYTFAKYSLAMAKESYERALQMHHEGKAYKDMISQMYYLDDDLKNDTIQFSTAIERYKINNGYIQEQLTKIQGIIDDAPMYEIENYTYENMNNLSLNNRFYLQH